MAYRKPKLLQSRLLGGEQAPQDLSVLIAMISDLQKTIALLTTRLARYENQEGSNFGSGSGSGYGSGSGIGSGGAIKYQGKSKTV